jgi:pilus assembly protein CpaF
MPVSSGVDIPAPAPAVEESLPSPTTVPVLGGVKTRLEAPSFTPAIQHSAQVLLDYIGDDESSEILMNGPNEISRKVRGARYHIPEIAFGDADTYHRVINEVVLKHTDASDRIDGKTVVIEGQLELHSEAGRPPMLARVHVIGPPGVQYAKVTIAKKPRFDLTLDDLAANGTLSEDEAAFLKAAARGRRTIVVSGPTGSGKTTFLQALTHCFDANDRVVVIEETPELRLPLGDVVYLRATLERPGMNPSEVFNLEFWTKQANRMRMDRVIVGETRGSEMADWLLAANSGAEGSATTVHANSARRALDKILALASKSDSTSSEAQMRREIAQTIDLIVQISLVDGRHLITTIEEVSDTVAQSTGAIQTNTIFEFDRTRGQHIAKGRPSDDFISALASHGVPVNNAWFRNL